MILNINIYTSLDQDDPEFQINHSKIQLKLVFLLGIL